MQLGSDIAGRRINDALTRRRPPLQLTDLTIRTQHAGPKRLRSQPPGNPADELLHGLLFCRGNKLSQ